MGPTAAPLDYGEGAARPSPPAPGRCRERAIQPGSCRVPRTSRVGSRCVAMSFQASVTAAILRSIRSDRIS